MKKTVCVALATIAFILMNFTSGLADRGRYGGHGGYGVRGGYSVYGGHGGYGWHGGVGITVAPGWWGSYYPYYPYYPPYYPYYQYYQEPPIVIQQQPDVYIQPVPQEEQQPVYWYFCKDPQGYYPYVKQCPKGWRKVVPTPPESSSEPPE
jgi:hypothetical protein